MTSVILIVIPTLNRSSKLRTLAENVRDATTSDNRVLFVVEAEDEASFAVGVSLRDDGLAALVVNNRTRCYAGAINSGYAAAVSEHIPFTHVLICADDVLFYSGWDVPALAVLAKRPEFQVAGTNDLHDPYVVAGKMASHYLIERSYIDEAGGVIDQPPGIVLCEAYLHGAACAEFHETACARGAWTPCLDSIVEHRHPAYGIGEWDASYEKNRSAGTAAADESAFLTRRPLWDNWRSRSYLG